MPLHPLQNHRDALAHTNAHGSQRISTASRSQLVCRGRHESRPGHPERMTHRNGAPVWVDVLSVVRKPELAKDCQSLRSKRFVELDHIHLFNSEAEPLQRFQTGRHRPHPHDPWSNARGGHRHDTRPRR